MENDLKSITDKITTDVSQLQQQDDKHYVPRSDSVYVFVCLCQPTTEVELRESLDAKLENQDVGPTCDFWEKTREEDMKLEQMINDHDFKPWIYDRYNVFVSWILFISASNIYRCLIVFPRCP